MKLISWNVNGLRACLTGFEDFFTTSDADIFCIQETNAARTTRTVVGYEKYWNSAVKGYSGTAIFTRITHYFCHLWYEHHEHDPGRPYHHIGIS